MFWEFEKNKLYLICLFQFIFSVFYFPNEIERDDENDLNICASALWWWTTDEATIFKTSVHHI